MTSNLSGMSILTSVSEKMTCWYTYLNQLFYMSAADCNILLPSLAWTAFYLRMALVQCSNCIYKIISTQAKVTEFTGILITGQCEVSDKRWYKSLNSASKDVELRLYFCCGVRSIRFILICISTEYESAKYMSIRDALRGRLLRMWLLFMFWLLLYSWSCFWFFCFSVTSHLLSTGLCAELMFRNRTTTSQSPLPLIPDIQSISCLPPVLLRTLLSQMFLWCCFHSLTWMLQLVYLLWWRYCWVNMLSSLSNQPALFLTINTHKKCINDIHIYCIEQGACLKRGFKHRLMIMAAFCNWLKWLITEGVRGNKFVFLTLLPQQFFNIW